MWRRDALGALALTLLLAMAMTTIEDTSMNTAEKLEQPSPAAIRARANELREKARGIREMAVHADTRQAMEEDLRYAGRIDAEAAELEALLPQPTELDLAAQSLREAEETLKAAQAARDAAMLRVVTLLGVKEGDEGTTSLKTEFFKVSATAKLTRSLDVEKLAEVKTQVVPDLFEKVVEYKPALNLKALRAIEQANPAAYRVFAQAVTVKPGKPTAKVELLEDK